MGGKKKKGGKKGKKKGAWQHGFAARAVWPLWCLVRACLTRSFSRASVSGWDGFGAGWCRRLRG